MEATCVMVRWDHTFHPAVTINKECSLADSRDGLASILWGSRIVSAL